MVLFNQEERTGDIWLLAPAKNKPIAGNETGSFMRRRFANPPGIDTGGWSGRPGKTQACGVLRRPGCRNRKLRPYFF
jgi:hypothetical protein